MTAYVTRAPLQLIQNPHMMSEVSRGHGRRTSARLADKEDAPLTNGVSHENEPAKKGASGKQAKSVTNTTGSKAGGKRKPGEQPWTCAHWELLEDFTASLGEFDTSATDS